MYFRTIHRIITTGHRITDQANRSLKEHGITEPQYNVLRTLFEAKGRPLTVQEIQSKMVQRSSNVTRIIDKLLSKEFVSRQECPTNRRKMDICLTALGKKELKRFDKVINQLHQPMQNNLTDAEQRQLFHLLNKLTQDQK